jgi:hypothetical protein
MARQIGLVSERGRLLIFDQLILGGPVRVERGLHTYAERFPAGAPDHPANEAARIRALGDIFKSDGIRFARRTDTIVSGKGSIRGITFDLNQLGVSDAE